MGPSARDDSKGRTLANRVRQDAYDISLRSG